MSDRQQKKLAVDVLEAQTINLVDEHGTTRASLSCGGDSEGSGGFSVVHLLDDERRPRISLQVDNLGDPSVILWTQENAPAVGLSVRSERGTGLTIGDLEGKPCIMMGVPGPGDPRNPTPEIRVIDEDGCREWSVFGGECELPDNDDEEWETDDE